jgi:hypothetical protein
MNGQAEREYATLAQKIISWTCHCSVNTGEIDWLSTATRAPMTAKRVKGVKGVG